MTLVLIVPLAQRSHYGRKPLSYTLNSLKMYTHKLLLSGCGGGWKTSRELLILLSSQAGLTVANFSGSRQTLGRLPWGSRT